MAVNVTELPAQIVEPVDTIETLGVTDGLIVMVTLFDVAVADVTHVRLEVSTQVIISPLTSVVVVYVEEVAPLMFVPFFFHW